MKHQIQPTTNSKPCSKCGESKPLSTQFFSKDRHSSTGLSSQCLICRRANVARWSARNADRCRARALRNYYANRERNIANTRRWQAANPVKARTNAFWSNTRQRIRNQIATYGRPVDITNMKYDRFRAARALGKRSGFEVRVCKELDDLHIAYKYEEITLPYIRPEEHTRYTPDLTFPNGLVIELKGRWETADRKKTRLIREQHPDVDLRMVFQNPSSRISKLSKTTYADICEKLGIKYAKQRIPLEWLQEPINHKSIAAMEAAQLCHRSSIAKRQSI